MSEGFVKVGQLSDFPAGSMKKVQVGADGVVVANLEGNLYAITSTCTHRGGPLEEGEIEGTVVVCPWHGGRFDLKTGKVLGPPPMKDEACFEVKLQGSEVLLRKK
jgi:3-phenylpropionate/trans-cinnamate dioxygenase ferredoxin subunit